MRTSGRSSQPGTSRSRMWSSFQSMRSSPSGESALRRRPPSSSGSVRSSRLHHQGIIVVTTGMQNAMPRLGAQRFLVAATVAAAAVSFLSQAVSPLSLPPPLSSPCSGSTAQHLLLERSDPSGIGVHGSKCYSGKVQAPEDTPRKKNDVVCIQESHGIAEDLDQLEKDHKSHK
eukprot:9488958-Pyramimonas_sp.AAC.1